MEDSGIVELYWRRDEAAIVETQRKYGPYCYAIASNILSDRRDAEESVNDTWAAAWNAMPPHRPETLSVFLGKITRQLSLKRRRARMAAKRGGGELPLAVEELEECIPAGTGPDAALEGKELAALIDAFLGTLPADQRRVFLCRYWYFDSIDDIAARFGFGNSKVKMMLKRTRERLLACLEREGVFL